MSRRFGRNQRRRMRKEIADLKEAIRFQRERAEQSGFNTRVLLDECMLAIDTFKQIGWADDCNAIRRMENAFTKLRGHYVADIYKRKLSGAKQ